MRKRSAYHFDDASEGGLGRSVEVGHPADIGDETDPVIDLTVTSGTRRIAIRLHLGVALGVAEAIRQLAEELDERLGRGEDGQDRKYEQRAVPRVAE